jgi:hypothetical protein
MAIAFKEWALVCDALGRGQQSVLLRKGGIAEPGNGFGFEHREFYFFPTWFHAQLEQVKIAQPVLPQQDVDNVSLAYAASVEWSGRVEDRDAVLRLSEMHVLEEAVVRERFDYDSGKEGASIPGLHVAFVRVFRLEPPISLPMEKRFGGCRSWVELPDVNPEAMVSVLSNEEHEVRRKRFTELLGVSF